MRQNFARKLVPRLGSITEWDLKNEIRILKKIENHKHPNIVQILKHGNLKGSQYYHIDMELCQLNLARYMEGDWPEAMQEGVYFGTTEGSVAHCWDIVK